MSARSTKGVEQEANEVIEAQGKLENVRKSNRAYTKTKVGDNVSLFFAVVGIGSSIIAYEVRYSEQEENGDIKDDTWVLALLWIATASTVLLLINTFFNYMLYI